MATDEEVEADAEKTRRRRRRAAAGGGGSQRRPTDQGARQEAPVFAGSFLLFLSFFCACGRASIGRLGLCLCVGTPEHLRLLLRVSEKGVAPEYIFFF